MARFVLHLCFEGMAVRRKLAIVGDGRSGKTCLLFALCHNQLPTFCEPALFDTCATDTEEDGKEMKLFLFDMSGKDEASYQNLRSVFCESTTIILICFSVDRPDSQQNVLDFWVPEIKLFCPTVPIILVTGTIRVHGVQ
uniref:Uncharacterized protein n=1 Tax=Pavo cristatus TaxID=9049 RepID=A0A8C9FMG5_PAVCR